MAFQSTGQNTANDEKIWIGIIALMALIFASFFYAIALMAANLPSREERSTQNAVVASETSAVPEATTWQVTAIPQWSQPVASPTLTWTQPMITPEPAIQAQSGGLVAVEMPWIQTPVAPLWQATAIPQWSQPVASPTLNWIAPVATSVPQQVFPIMNTLPMPPLQVVEPDCSFNPIYLGFDPRIGCRMPVGESVISAELIVNGQLLSMVTSFGFSHASQPVVAQPGQILIWEAANQMACIAWNPSITIGYSDAVVVRLHTDARRSIEEIIIVHQAYLARTAMNPHPAAHTCGYSPDRTYLRAEIGDSLHRFMLGLDLVPSDTLWNAWYNLHGSYDLIAGTTYAVPQEWQGNYVQFTGK